MQLSALKYWVWLSSLSGVGAASAGALIKYFGTPEKVFLAGTDEYKGIEGVKPSAITRLSRKNIEDAVKILSSCADLGFRVITMQDAEYPDRLKNIYDPPIVLYVRGNLPVIDEEAAVAIVGTRSCTPYGIGAADTVGYRLARRGVLVVTGLARGVDSAAARGALRCGGRVVGVIGSGLDVIYPSENESLFDEVAAKGAILSEYAPGTPAIAAHFPARNRILSGLSIGVAVIEAPKRSGALITAARALEQGRDVFALPGNVGAKSCEGSNSLLREGAIPFLSADDIVDEYVGLYPGKITESSDDSGRFSRPDNEIIAAREKKVIDNEPPVDYIDLDKILNTLSGDEKAVAAAIGNGNFLIDEIIVRSGLPAQNVLTAMTMLEIKGFVSRGKGNYISLRG